MKKSKEVFGGIFRFPLYLILISLYFPLAVFQSNFSLFSFDSTLRTLGFSTAFSLVLFYLLSKISNVHSAGVYTVFLFVALLAPNVAVGFSLACFFVVFFLFLSEKIFTFGESFTLSANVASIFFLGMLLFGFGKLGLEVNTLPSDKANDLVRLSEGRGFVETPDIYHFVLDGYSNSSVLSDFYSFDNSKFEDGLEDLGFLVMQKAISPYNQTLPSMASVMSGEFVVKPEIITPSNPHVLRVDWGKQVTDGVVPRLFRMNGYSLAFENTGYDFLSYPIGSFVNDDALGYMELGPFEEYFLSLSPLKAAFSLFGDESVVSIESRNKQVRANLSSRYFESVPQPRYYYSHTLAPHPPFSLTKNGETTFKYQDFLDIGDGDHMTKGDEELVSQYKQGYIEKLTYTNSQIYTTLKYLVEDVPGNKIVIVQGDHGGGAHLRHDSNYRTCHKERFSPLYAVYSSDSKVFSSIDSGRPVSTVNTYRHILRYLLKVDVDLVSAQAYFLSWDRPFLAEPLAGQENALCQIQFSSSD
ncbi:sulfatase-like hydrolase/transferase [Microbulbifer aggregans]|uniref:sulfatase-like hydrolase/transferase n=1 Tax=Microbulbifer aggregans TaxID=1769779 RepID=UPI001CFF4576|nr:sulfatase-like hydrolase/transferase [Microbulbifer aggregans]